jgi:hypothetical protein
VVDDDDLDETTDVELSWTVPSPPRNVAQGEAVRNRLTFVPRVFHIPQFVSVDQSPSGVASGDRQPQVSVLGLDIQLINSIVDVGLEVITLIGTFIMYLVLRRQRKKERTEADNRRIPVS